MTLAAITVITATGCASSFQAADATTAANACFEPDTALLFSGRTTTAALGVQEVVGDPMSHVPADISITRDEFDQGKLRGRLVCAVYTEPPGFVEVTVVPDGWELGAPRPPDPVTPEPTPLPERPSTDLAEADVIEIAREAVTDGRADVSSVTSGPAAERLAGFELYDWVAAIPRDRWVWHVVFDRGNGEGTTVVIDYVDGTVYGWIDWIS